MSSDAASTSMLSAAPPSPAVGNVNPLVAVEAELQRVQKQIDAVEQKINEAEAELRKPLQERDLVYWRDKEKQLGDEKKQLRDKELLLLQRTGPVVNSASGQTKEKEKQREKDG